jgi:hypothetical protein
LLEKMLDIFRAHRRQRGALQFSNYIIRRVARFFLAQYTKSGKIYQVTNKYIKWT